MSDNDKTILSSSGADGVSGAPPPEKAKRNPLFIIGGIGCALLLCAGALIAGGFFLVGDQINNLVSGDVPQDEPPPSPTLAPTATFTPTPLPTEESSSEVNVDEDDELDSDTADIVVGPPQIGTITFALGATEDYQPIDPGTSFADDVTEIHAIFEYSGLSPDFSWERVWYLDGNEMLRSEEAWTGAEAGVFDYFINAGGETLAPGEWELELFVDGELLTTGTFDIVAEAPAEVAVEATEEVVEESLVEAEATSEPTATPEPTATSAPVAPVASTYQLAYTKWDGGRHNLYVNDTKGSSEQFVMHNAAGPSWSPDGASIFFFGEPGVNIQNRDAFPNIGSCELPGVSDGIVVVSVPPSPAEVCVAQSNFHQGEGWNDGTARWASVSPNGQMVAYDAKPGGDYRIYFLGTSDNKQYSYEIIGEQADWSPDSQQIVYRSGRDGKTGIWISNRDDSGHVLVSNANDSFPAWSTDGKTIAFARDEGSNVDIYTMNVDGTNVQRLTDTPGPDTLPVFTPSGQIVFRSARSGSWAIWTMNGDGSNPQEIVADAGVGPDWAYSKMSVLP